MPRALLVVRDLMARTRLEAAGAARGIDVVATTGLGALPADAPDLVVIDLDLPDVLDGIATWLQRWPDLRVTGFVSHVDTARRDAAERLGVVVSPRGATAKDPGALFEPISW